jgi:hypothetical protein
VPKKRSASQTFTMMFAALSALLFASGATTDRQQVIDLVRKARPPFAK